MLPNRRLHEPSGIPTYLLLKEKVLTSLSVDYDQNEYISPMSSWIHYEANKIFSSFPFLSDAFDENNFELLSFEYA